jgi:hypothetical protein
MSARIALEAIWLVPALRLARRRDGLPEAPGSGEPGDPADPRGMKTEQLAVVQVWADTRRSLRRWNAPPPSVLRRGRCEPRSSAVLLLAATVARSRRCRRPIPSAPSSPA